MAQIQVLAGDFLKGPGQFLMSTFTLRTPQHRWIGETIPADQLVSVEEVTSETEKRVGGAVMKGLVGAAFLGPVGLLAGTLSGGHRTTTTLALAFEDGRRLFGTTDHATFVAIQAALFQGATKARQQEVRRIEEAARAEREELEAAENAANLVARHVAHTMPRQQDASPVVATSGVRPPAVFGRRK